ncbi:voltage-gated potassium channel [Aureococcus anophagefferens]|uniref:Voltage-gated potassium channel n=1 Tax=Aureococcus anophagefferens TaxID=44056 RepID=A0ABR1FJG6_AURAN
MEAFACVGLNLRCAATTIEADEWARCVVDVGLVVGDEAPPAPWELCGGAINVGLACGARRRGAPPLTAGRLSAVKALYLYVRFASSGECAFPPRALVELRARDARRADADDAWTVVDEPKGYANVYGERPVVEGVYSSPLGIDGPREPAVLASHGDVPSHFASFVLDVPLGLTLQRCDDVAPPEAFSFEMTDSRGDARHVACVKFDWRLEDGEVSRLRRGVERDARTFRPSLATAWSAAWGDDDDDDDDDDATNDDPESPKAPRTPVGRDETAPLGAGQARDAPLGAHLDERATYAGFAPVVFCVVFRRPDALACMRTACFELFRLALSRNRRAFQILLATLAAVDLPSPESRVDLRCVFVDSAKTPEQRAPLRDMVVPSSGVARAGLRSLDDKDAWLAFLRALEPPDFARLLELVLLEKPVLVCGAQRAPSFFLDALKTLLFPLSWALPSVDRLPERVAADLLSGVVPVLAAIAHRRGREPRRVVPEGVDDSVVVVDVAARTLDVGIHGDAPTVAAPAEAFVARVEAAKRRCYVDVDAEGLAVRDAFAPLISSLLDGRATRQAPDAAPAEGYSASGFRGCFDSEGYCGGDAFRRAFAETQMFAVYVQRIVEVHLRADTAVSPAADGPRSELLDAREAHAKPCVAVVARVPLLDGAAAMARPPPDASEWALLVGDEAASVAAALFETMRDLRVLPGQITFSLFALAASGNDPARGLEAPDLFARNASASRSDSAAPRRPTFAGPDGVEEDHPLAWLELSGVRFCAERKVDTAFLGRVDDLADEDGRLFSAGDALFGSYKRRRRSATLHRAAALDDGDARRVALWPEPFSCDACGREATESQVLGAVLDGADERGLVRLVCKGCRTCRAFEATLAARDGDSETRVAYGGPGDLRVALEERLATRGERSLGADALRREVPHLYYGALWYAARLRLPIIFRGDGRRALLLLLGVGATARAALAAPGPPEPEGARVEAADPGADAGAPPPPPPETEGGDVRRRRRRASPRVAALGPSARSRPGHLLSTSPYFDEGASSRAARVAWAGT